MKKAYVLHGWGGNPKEAIHKWLKKTLEEKGYEVIAPEMPNTDEPEIKAWTGKLKEVVGKDLDNETYFIGHSIGCQTILRYLEKLPEDIKVGKVILVAPWLHLDEETIKEEGEEVIEIAKPWVETPIDFEKVKTHCNSFICVFSDDDPYVPLSEADLFKDKLGAKIIIKNKQGHFTEYSDFVNIPELLDLI